MVNTLYLSTAGTASLDFRDKGTITGICIMWKDVAVGAGEVSFNSSSSLTTNDTTGVIAGVLSNATAVANGQYFPLQEPVDVGERIFLHVTGALNETRVFIMTDSAPSRPSTRRR